MESIKGLDEDELASTFVVMSPALTKLGRQALSSSSKLVKEDELSTPTRTPATRQARMAHGPMPRTPLARALTDQYGVARTPDVVFRL